MIDPPTACECCGGNRLRKLGEDVTLTLETQPRRWKVIETVREKFTCRDCEKITQAPAPFHVIARGWAGPSLLAMIVFEKFGQHQPLNRQAERYTLEGVPIALSTMADAVGSVCAALDPLLHLVESHVMAAARLHADDTTVPVLAEGKTDTGRCWIYLRDDRPFGGTGPPAAIFYYSRDRRGEHPQSHLAGYAGILQADAYDGYDKLYQGRSWRRHVGCMPGARSSPWPTSRRTLDAKPRARKRSRCRPSRSRSCAVSTRCSRSSDPSTARAPGTPGRQADVSRPLVDDLQVYMRAQVVRLARGHDLAKAIKYIFKRWAGFTLFLEDGRVCLSNKHIELRQFSGFYRRHRAPRELH